MARQAFIDSISESLLRLPQDLRTLLRMVEDGDLDDESRVAICGGLLHLLAAGSVIPGARGLLRYVGDILIVRLLLDQVRKRSPEAFAAHSEQAPELFAPLDTELSTALEYLGAERMSVLERAADRVSTLNHHGHTAQACVSDTESANWLYDAVTEALVEQFEFEEQDVVRELKGIDSILDPLASRAKAK